MKRYLFSTTGLLLIAVLFIAVNILNNLILGSVRIDLTENNIYTITDGTKEIIDSIDEPITLDFYFSDKVASDAPGLRTYAKRVQELIQEYEIYSDQKITVNVIDPQPFTEEEDQATAFRLQGIPINNIGEQVFFGLVGKNSIGDYEVIPFFQPDKEEFLEYDLSKLIYTLVNSKKPIVGLMTDLEIDIRLNPQTNQPSPPLVVLQQIRQLFAVQTVATDVAKIPEEVDILLLIHPKDLSEETLYAIDQFVLAGGKAMVFVDPLATLDRPEPTQGMMGAVSQSSDLDKLFANWGVRLTPGKVLGDVTNAVSVSTRQGGQPARNISVINLKNINMAQDEISTSQLETLYMGTVGLLEVLDEKTTQVTPLLSSSVESAPLDVMRFQFLANPRDLLDGFIATDNAYVLAARINGPVSSAFAKGLGGDDQAAQDENTHIEKADNINVIVVADTDLLADAYWVQKQQFLGQTIVQPFADNGGFVVNSLDTLTGSSALISVRSRGRYQKPFTRVEALQAKAEQEFRDSEQKLQEQLQQAEQKLSELQQSKQDQNVLQLSPEQEAEVLRFEQEKLKIRKELREVNRKLNEDIEDLGTRLKIMNIAGVPVLLTLFAFAVTVFRSRARRQALTNR